MIDPSASIHESAFVDVPCEIGLEAHPYMATKAQDAVIAALRSAVAVG